MKKNSFIIGIMLISILYSMPVLAEGKVPTQNYIVEKELSDNLETRMDKIVKKFRVYNGVLQYRRWNETKGKWVDPYWIDM